MLLTLDSNTQEGMRKLQLQNEQLNAEVSRLEVFESEVPQLRVSACLLVSCAWFLI